MVAPAAAGIATVCASTSLTGVVAGVAWFGYVLVAVLLIACTGLALRSLRAPTLVVGLSQLVVLTFLITGVFTSEGILGIIPGPAAIGQLQDVLISSAEQIRTGLAPVEPTPAILCLSTIAIGLVAVLIDTLTVAAAAPAATGLVLLCVYAVPASLSNDLLPWWTFVVGAAAFAGLLAVDGSHRHRRWRNRTAPGLGVSAESTAAPVTVVSLALVCGLLGGTITAVGTVGSIPGDGPGSNMAGGTGGLGVNPFTNLRGLLNQGANVELFRVRGLQPNDPRLLRAFTLDFYQPNQGWKLADAPRMPAGDPANMPALPLAPGDSGEGQSVELQIEPINWVDVWLPVYGAPRALRGISEGWFYDRKSGAVFSERKQRSPAYTEVASLRVPTKEELRAEGTEIDRDLDPVYTRLDQVDPRVRGLAQQLTAGQASNFDKSVAIWQYFSSQNGFTYDTQTAAAADNDALADFLFNGKRGFCEQYASAMAVLLRSAGIPARVAVGFTPGVTTAGYRTITSQDAHAWVEVYFNDQGWVSFDPTPLADGRGYIPPYLRPDDQPTDGPATSGNDTQEMPSTSAQAPNDVPREETGPQEQQQAQETSLTQAPDGFGWGVLALLLLAAAVTAAVVMAMSRRLGGRGSGAAAVPGGVPPPGGGSATLALAPWLPPVITGLWVLVVAAAAWLWSIWLALPVAVVVAVVAGPWTIREVVRRRRLRTIAADGAGAADAAWSELLDECADRGVPAQTADTARMTAFRVAQKHRLDDDGQAGLRTVVGVLERSWYAPPETKVPEPDFAPAFDRVRGSLARNAPMSWRGRLFPKSLLRRRRNRRES
ncbi:transglutaminase domain-containing protein [Amycolatopsis suaedae]|uniref:Transglutaminase domain-containing protein n=1 Tax=Amycolatopsis suaedae TaxID=2510978 RepID=A0A4Q7J0J3_9PSEU|nr:transglutaminase domain-containing protein [Amycolatopsis suaedae]